MRALVIGEGMVEFTRQGEEGSWAQGIGGDTLNTAVNLARLGANVAFASAVGQDIFSDTLRAAIAAEGIETALLASDPARQCGIYFIATDESGERSFTYWRSQSAARRLVETIGTARLAEAAAAVDLVHLSLITLAVISEDHRQSLLDLVTRAKGAGTKVSFDSNYRPALWESPETAAHWSGAFAAIADFGLPTFEDEVALGTGASATDVSAAWEARGCGEVVVKLGGEGCLLPDGRICAAERVNAVDTSGAGDSFDAAYLHCRLSGQSPERAARRANRLAGWVVGRKGALPAAEADAYRPRDL